MKRLTFLLSVLVLMLISSCDESIQKVDNPEKITTVEHTQGVKDTVLLYKETTDKFVIIDKETNLVEYELYSPNYGNTIILVAFIIGIYVGLVVFYIFSKS